MTLQKARLSLLLLLFICSFIFIRIYSASPVFLFQYGWDDAEYFIYTDSLYRTHDFDWCNPNLTNKDFAAECLAKKASPHLVHAYNMYPPGPAMTILPVTALGWLLYKVHIFEPSNIDVLLFWTIIGSFVLFILGTWFLFESTLYFLKDISLAWWWTVLFTVGNATIYFIFRRPAMSHPAEFFLFFASLYTLIKLQNTKKIIPTALILGFLCSMMLITRLNNIHIPGFIGIMLLFWPGQHWQYKRFSKIFVFLLGGIPPILLLFWLNYLQLGSFFYKPENYFEAYTLGFFLKFYWVNIYRIFLWFIGPHWGMFWIMPIYLVEFFFFIKFRKTILTAFHKKYRLPIFLIIIMLLIHLNILANGPITSSYAYRYLFSYYYFIHILFIFLLAKIKNQVPLTRKLKTIGITCAVIASLHILNFESNSTNLTLNIMPISSEGVYHPFWQKFNIYSAPYYVLYSYKNIIQGKALLNLAASPTLAYPIMLASDFGLGQLPGINSAVSYYQSKNRKIFHLSDLKLAFEFQIWYFIMLSVIGLAIRKIPSLGEV